MKRVCVFCGSGVGTSDAFGNAARSLGEGLARRGIGLVYGGAAVGLMGLVADGALAAGGEVTGVLPRALEQREIGHRALTELHMVDSMHERKAMMANLADAFIALPGGLGTLDELFEIWTWAQLGMHQKPFAILEVQGYYAPLLAFLDGAVAQGFVTSAARARLIVGESVESLLDALAAAH